MVLLEHDRVLYAQVADVSRRGRILMVMGVLVQRVVRGQVPDRPVHGRRPHIRVILEQLRERPALSPFNLEVRDFRPKVLVGRPELQLDIREDRV